MGNLLYILADQKIKTRIFARNLTGNVDGYRVPDDQEAGSSFSAICLSTRAKLATGDCMLPSNLPSSSARGGSVHVEVD